VTTGQVSIANVAVDLALTRIGALAEARILVLGAGEMAEKGARAFHSRGARHVAIANRHFERADALARSLGDNAIPFDEREARLADCDIVVASTASPGTVISRAAVQSAMATRPDRPLLLIDLAMPRDVEESAASVANVFLYNLDDLARVAAQNRQARLAEADTGRIALAPRTEALWGQLQLQLTTLPGERRAPATGAAPQPVLLPGAVLA
jgi:glutamyl-tRNA reductase